MNISRFKSKFKGALHNAIALIISVCMVCSLTPTLAMAENAKLEYSGDGSTATGSTDVKGKIRDKDFVLALSGPGASFTTVQALKDAMAKEPFVATMKEGSVPDKFGIAWYVAKLVYNSTDNKWEPEKGADQKPITARISGNAETEIVKADYTKISGNLVDGNVVFKLPADGNISSVNFPSWFVDDARYQISVQMSDLTPDAGQKHTDATVADITISENYKPGMKGATEDPTISIYGDLYKQGANAELNASKINESTGGTGATVLQALRDKAKNTSPAETVVEANTLGISYTAAGPGAGEDYYTGTLDVYVPLPQSLYDTLPGAGLAADNKDETLLQVTPYGGATPTNKVNVYVRDAAGAVTSKQGTLTYALNPKQPYLTNDTSQPNYLMYDISQDPKKICKYDAGNGKYYWEVTPGGTRMYVDNANLRHVVVVKTGISGTGAELGTFGVGTFLGDQCFTVKTVAESTAPEVDGVKPPAFGIVSPGGTTTNVPTVGTTLFTAQSMAPGNVFAGFELTVKANKDAATGTTFNATQIAAADANALGFNTFALDPTKFGIAKDNYVVVKGYFTPQSDQSSNQFSVSLINDGDGATGTLVLKTSGGSGMDIINMGGSKSISVKGDQSVILDFGPSTDPLCYVESVVCTTGRYKGAVKFSGTQYNIGALSQATEFVVKYKKGKPPVQIPAGVNINIPVSEKLQQPAKIDGGITGVTTANSGNTVTFTTNNNPNYDLRAIKITVNGETTTYYGVKNADGGYDVPFAETNTDFTSTKFTILNVTESMQIELVFQIADGVTETDHEDEDYWGWTKPEDYGKPKEAAQLDAGNAAAKLAKAALGIETAYAEDEIVHSEKNVTLEAYQRTQLKITNEPGYALGSVYFNGDRVNNLLTPRYSGDTIVAYTITVYRGEKTEGVGMGQGRGNAYPPFDNVYYLNQRKLKFEINRDPVITPVNEFFTVETSATHGGSITPTKKVAKNGEATICFIPNEGFKVQTVDVNGTVLTPKTDSDYWVAGMKGYAIHIGSVTADMSVSVSFAPGTPETNPPTKAKISASAGAGGTISPSGTYEAYIGSSEAFAIVPGTGYEISTFTVNGENKKDKLSAQGVYSLTNIQADTTIEVTFAKANSTATSFNVRTTVVGSGFVFPSESFVAARGANVNFTMIPKYTDAEKWYISDIRVKYGSSASDSSGVPMFGLMSGEFAFTLKDVQDDTEVLVTFSKSDNGKFPGTSEDVPEPPSDSDTITIKGTNIKVLPEANPGAFVSPALETLKLVKKSGGAGIEGDLCFTINVAAGYDYKGIEIKSDGLNGSTKLVENTDYTVTKVTGAVGQYNVVVKGAKVTPDFAATISTQLKAGSTSEVTPYKITTSVKGNGTISPSGTDKIVNVEPNRGQSFSFIPNEGNVLHAVYVDGKQVSVTNNIYNIPSVRADMTIEAVFAESPGAAKPKTFTVSIDQGSENKDKCTISPMGQVEVVEGANLSIFTQPTAGYKAVLTANGVDLDRVGNTFELKNIKANTTILAKIEPDVPVKYYNFTVTNSGPGATSPGGSQLVVEKSTQTLTLTPNNGMYLKSVKLVDALHPESNALDLTSAQYLNKTNLTVTTPSIERNTTVNVEYTENASEAVPGTPAGSDALKRVTVTTTVKDGKGGVVTPAFATVAQSGSLTLTFVPQEGYILESVKTVGAVAAKDFTARAKGGTLSLGGSELSANLAIEAVFTPSKSVGLEDFYTVITSVTGAGGTISPAGKASVAGGGSFTLTMMPEPKYTVDRIVINGVTTTLNGATGYTIYNITKDQNVFVSFRLLSSGEQGSSVLTHKITATASVNGAISPAGEIKVADGKNSAYSFVPNPGCQLAYVNVDGVSINPTNIANNQFIFTNVKADHTIHAVFRKDGDTNYHTITATASDNGTISPGGSTLVGATATKKFTVSGYYGYAIDYINIGAGTPYRLAAGTSDSGTKPGYTYNWDGKDTLTVSAVSADITINAYFKTTGAGAIPPDQANYYYISGSKSGNGSGYISAKNGYIKVPQNWSSAVGEEKTPRITVLPDEGSKLSGVTITYGDNTNVVYDATSGTNISVIEGQGFVEYQAEKAASTGSVHIEAKFDKGTPSGTLPQHFEVDVTSSGSGKITPTGKVKVVAGNALNLQFLPQEGYAISSVKLDGVNVASKLDEGSKTDKLIIPNIQANHTVEGVFAYVGVESTEYKTVNASVNGGNGQVTPTEVKAASGSNVTLQFLPDEGYKIADLTVTGGTTANNYSGAYSLPTYTINNIANDYTVRVTYEKAAEGDTPWKAPQTVELTATSAGNGKVSPASQLVPQNTSGTLYFEPERGYQVDYIMVNNAVTKLSGNPTSYKVAVTTQNVAAVVYFKKAEAEDAKDVTINTSVDGDGATITPATTTVKSGESVNFFVTFNSGRTIDKVTFNGWEVSAEPAVPAGVTPDKSKPYKAYVVKIDNVQPGEGSDANLVVKTKATSYPLENVSMQKLTIQGNNCFLDPLGQMNVPVGQDVKIRVTGITGYYLDSITASWKEGSKDVSRDIYNSIEGDVLTYKMGAYDTTIDVQYKKISAADRSMVNVRLASATLQDDNSSIDLANVLIGTAIDSKGEISPTKRNESGILIKDDGSLMEFVRGSAYPFYASASGKDSSGKAVNYVLVSATYDGAEQRVGDKDNTIHDVVLNASADLKLVFRKLKDGEQIKPVTTYPVRLVLENEGGENPAQSEISVPLGGSATLAFTSKKGYMVAKDGVVVKYLDKNGSPVLDDQGNPMITTPSAEEYKNETYTVSGVWTTTEVHVTFVPAKDIEVTWDNQLGFITPNPGGAKLKWPVDADGSAKVNFVIAPYAGNYVESVTVDMTGGAEDPKNVTSSLTQGADVIARLQQAVEGAKVLKVKHGMTGVATPDNDPTGEADAPSSDAPSTDAPKDDKPSTEGDKPKDDGPLAALFSLFGIRAADDSGDAVVDDTGITNGTTEDQKTYERAYGLEQTIPSEISLMSLNAKFYRPNAADPSNKYVITASAGEHGKIQPSGEVEVFGGTEQSFTMIPDEGYVVTDVKVDNVSVGAQYQYTFTNLDANHTINVTFGVTGGTSSGIDRFVKVAAGLAQTGDLTMPAIILFSLLLALGILMMVLSSRKRKREEAAYAAEYAAYMASRAAQMMGPQAQAATPMGNFTSSSSTSTFYPPQE